MRNPERISTVIFYLRQAWRRNPDLRLGQLISAMAGNVDVFHVEDYDLIKNGIDKFNLNMTIKEETWPEYWIEPNAFAELIERLNKGEI